MLVHSRFPARLTNDAMAGFPSQGMSLARITNSRPSATFSPTAQVTAPTQPSIGAAKPNYIIAAITTSFCPSQTATPSVASVTITRPGIGTRWHQLRSRLPAGSARDNSESCGRRALA